MTGRSELFEAMLKKKGIILPQREAIPRRDTYSNSGPLSYAQERLWFLSRWLPESPVYNIPAVLRLRGALDVTVLERSLTALIQRHEILRTVFVQEAGQLVQHVMPSLPLSLPAVDLCALSGEQQKERVQQIIREKARVIFSLERGPLLLIQLVDLAENEHILVLVLHHIIMDGWSQDIFMRELAAYYQFFSVGSTIVQQRLTDANPAASLLPDPLPTLAYQYRDYSLWQRNWLRGEELEKQLRYWQTQLADAPAVLDLPTDRLRPSVQTFEGAI